MARGGDRAWGPGPTDRDVVRTTTVEPRARERYAAELVRNDQVMNGNGNGNVSKRKRPKRGEEWMTAAPAPPPPLAAARIPTATTSVSSTDGTARAVGMMGMPAILHHGNTTPVDYDGNPVTNAIPIAQNNVSVFEDAPVVRTFAETRERGGLNSNTASTASSPARSTTNSVSAAEGQTEAKQAFAAIKQGAANGGGVPRTMLHLFFPDLSQGSPSNGLTNGVTTQHAKRRRRNEAAPSTRSSRSNARRGVRDRGRSEDDLLRFGVDSAKLVPQGLVDRVDAQQRPEFVAQVIVNHVENWIKRAAFGASDFVRELSALLVAYYPCAYATLLDEVLASFLFKRPEFIAALLSPLVNRLRKPGESIFISRCPVADSIAKMCVRSKHVNQASERQRHATACMEIMRSLLILDSGKHLVSPWIAACAINSVEDVLDDLWTRLLRLCLDSGGTNKPNDGKYYNEWVIPYPAEQITELVREERQIGRTSEEKEYRLSRSLLHRLIDTDDWKTYADFPFVSEAFESFFMVSATRDSAALMQKWLEKCETGVSARNGLQAMFNILLPGCSRISVKKSNWFVKHVVRFVVETQDAATIRATTEWMVREHIELILGSFGACGDSGKDANAMDIDEEDRNERIAVPAKNVERFSEEDVEKQVAFLVDVLRELDQGTEFLDAWLSTWSNQPNAIRWFYVWPIIHVALNADDVAPSKFDSSVVSFAGGVCHAAFKKASSNAELQKMIQLLLKSRKTGAQLLLSSILDAVSQSKDANVKQTVTVFSNAIVSCIHSSKLNHGAERKLKQHLSSLTLRMKDSTNVSTVLSTLTQMASTHDAPGRMARNALCEPRVIRVFGSMLSSANDQHAVSLLGLISTVARNCPDKQVDYWSDERILHGIVHYAYLGTSTTSTRAVAVLEAISRRSVDPVSAVLWPLVRQCSAYCCRGNIKQHTDQSVIACADLTKELLCRSPNSRDEIAEYMYKRIAICCSDSTRWNLFLMVSLDRIIQLELRPSNVMVLQFVFAHLRREDADDQTQVVILQVLNTLCNELSMTQDSPAAEDSLKILLSEHIDTKLHRIVSHSACPCSVALAENVLSCRAALKMQLRV